MDSWKVLTVLICAFLTGGIVATWHQSQIFPWLHIGILGSLSLVVLGQLRTWNPAKRFYWTTLTVIVISLIYRGFTAVFPPTPIGYDPDKYALFSRLTLHTGSYHLPSSDFYAYAGAFHTFIAEIAAITGTTPEAALTAISVIYSILLPLGAASVILRFCGRTDVGYDAASISVLLVSVAAMSTRMAIWPIAQSLGTLLFILGIIVSFWLITHRTLPNIILFCLFLVAMATAHKLTVLLFTFVLGSIWIVGYVIDLFSMDGRHSVGSRIPGIAVVLSGVVLVVQYMYFTDFIHQAIELIIAAIAAGHSISRSGADHPAAASVPDPGILWPFFSHSYAIITLAVAGFMWTFIAWTILIQQREIRYDILALLTVTGTLVGVFLLSIGGALEGDSANPFRFYVHVEFFILVLIAIGLAVLMNKRFNWTIMSWLQMMTIGVVSILLVFHVMSAGIAPDYPAQQREYLTNAEMEGKEFAADFVPTEVAADDKYVRETHYPERVDSKEDPLVALGTAPRGGQFYSDSIGILEGTYIDDDHPAMLYRPGASIINTPSGYFTNYRYMIEWDIESEGDVTHQRTYDNSGAILYQNQTVVNNTS